MTARPTPRTTSEGRVLTAWLPHWAVTAAGTLDRPAIVLHANCVVDASPPAMACGVAVGQRRRHAQRACPDATVLAHDPDRDHRAFEPVVAAVSELTPRLEVVDAGWINIDARGPSRYYGGDPAVAAKLIDTITAAVPGVHVQVGVADGRFAAAVAARLANQQPTIVPPGGSPAFLAPLPVRWLHETGDVEAELVGLFGRLGLHHLGDLAALAATDLAARFGPAGSHAHQLAAGRDDRPVHGVEPPPLRVVEDVFDTPVEAAEPVVFTGKRLADQLTARLATDGQVCTRLVVTVETDHHERDERIWYRTGGLTAPAIVDRLRWQLTAWIATGQLTSGITMLRFTVDESRPDTGRQPGLWGGQSDADQAAIRTVARLATIAGDHAVTVPAWHGGYLPNDRYRWVPATTVDLADADATDERLCPPLRDRDGRTGPWPGTLPAPAPIALHQPPKPAVLTDDAGNPVEVTGRGDLSATPATLTIGEQPARTVAGWAGPWPLHQWWTPMEPRRAARLQLVTDTGTAYLAVAEAHRWWITATYS